MPRMIQIRNVPEDIHRKLKSRAALAGQSLSDFLLMELRRILERPTRAELLARIYDKGPRPALSVPAADIVRQEREGR